MILSCSPVNKMNKRQRMDYMASILSTYFYFPDFWLCTRFKKYLIRQTNKGSSITLYYSHQMTLLYLTWNLLVPPSEAEWNGPQVVSRWVRAAARSLVAWALSTPSWSCCHSSRPCCVELSCKEQTCSSQCTSVETGGTTRWWASLQTPHWLQGVILNNNPECAGS